MNLDVILVVISAILVVCLSWVGIEMANDPPTTTRLKWRYRLIFIVVGLLSITVTLWQDTRNRREQAAITSSAERDRRAIQSQYDQLQGQLKTINQFVEHPPSGLTEGQVAEVVKAQIDAALRAAGTSGAKLAPTAVAAPPPLPASPDLQALRDQGLEVAKGIKDWITLVRPDMPATGSGDPTKTRAYVNRIDSEWDNNFATQAESFLRKVPIRPGYILSCQRGAILTDLYHNDPATILQMRKTCADRIQQAALDVH